MFKKTLNNVRDISDEEIKNIKDREVLLKEFDYINKAIVEKEKLANNVTLIFISGLGIMCWNLLQGLSSLVSLIYGNNNNNGKIINFIELNFLSIANTGQSIIFIFVILFIFMTLSELSNRRKLIERKNLILYQLNKKKSYYHKTSKSARHVELS
ncbi:MAG: hypothetical protein NTZ60_09475 [Campylobacterales bacterium]|nr:hypothetical protein [Campylobacterales bacterium]